jgi:hypothetical protein
MVAKSAAPQADQLSSIVKKRTGPWVGNIASVSSNQAQNKTLMSSIELVLFDVQSCGYKHIELIESIVLPRIFSMVQAFVCCSANLG